MKLTTRHLPTNHHLHLKMSKETAVNYEFGLLFLLRSTLEISLNRQLGDIGLMWHDYGFIIHHQDHLE